MDTSIAENVVKQKAIPFLKEIASLVKVNDTTPVSFTLTSEVLLSGGGGGVQAGYVFAML